MKSINWNLKVVFSVSIAMGFLGFALVLSAASVSASVPSETALDLEALSQENADSLQGQENIDPTEEGLRQELEAQAEQLYQQAVHFYQTENFKDARAKFIEIEALRPGFKDTLDYLSRLDDEIFAEPAAETQAEAVEPLSVDSREQNSLDAVRFRSEVEALYQEAVDLYSKQEFIQAMEKWDQVEQLWPDFQSTRNYLKLVDQAIEQKKRQLEEERIAALEEEFQENPPESEQLEQGQSLPEDQIEQVETKQEDKKETQRERRRRQRKEISRMRKDLDAQYREAVALFKSRDYQAAEEELEQLRTELSQAPLSSRELEHRLKKVERYSERIQEKERKAEEQKEKANALLAEKPSEAILETETQIEEPVTAEAQEEESFVESSPVEEPEVAEASLEEPLDIEQEESVSVLEESADFPDEARSETLPEEESAHALTVEVPEIVVRPGSEGIPSGFVETQEIVAPQVIVRPSSRSRSEAEAEYVQLLALQRKAEEEMIALEQKREEVFDALHRELKELYQRGVQSFEEGAYSRALGIFQDVEDISPDYKLTRQFLSDLSEKIVKERK